MPYTRGISPMTTWHSQSGLLLISFTWGMSYLIPPRDRIPFSEVFPDTLHNGPFPMWGWGLVLILFAGIAFGVERWLNRHPDAPAAAWGLGWGSHMVLSAAYVTLGAAALWQSLLEVTGPVTSLHFWLNVISSISRTVLWCYIGWLHSTYAKLPRVVVAATPEEAVETTAEEQR